MSEDLPDDLAKALQKARYNEFVRLSADDEHGNKNDILLFACLDEENGGIQWRNLLCDDESISVDPTAQFFQTKRWVFPMLNDVTRNEMYQRAIHCAVQKLRDRLSITNDSVERMWSVLDIGSGTGFLGMLAAKEFQESMVDDKVKVMSIEMAEEMASVARRTIHDNQLSDVIEVVEGHSCELPPISPKADLCVSELLESGLLGEGILRAVRDAWERHLRDDAIVIPQRARVFAQLVGCKDGGTNWMENFCGPHNHEIAKAFGGDNQRPLRWSLDRDGCSLLLDARQVQIPVHAKKLFEAEMLISLSDAVPVFAFDFTSRDAAMFGSNGRRQSTDFAVTTQGTVNGVLLWWELDLWEGITYSCEPGNNRFKITGSNVYSYYQMVITCTWGLGSKTEPESKKFKKGDSDASLISPFRAYQLNDNSRLQAFKVALEYCFSVHVNGKAARILDISDGGWGACLAAVLGATNVLSIEGTSDEQAMMAARIAQCGNGLPLSVDGAATVTFDIILSHLENLTSNDLWGHPSDIVIADYFSFFEDWHLQGSLDFSTNAARCEEGNVLSDQTIVLPCSFRVMACAIESEQLRSAYSSCGDEHGRILGLDHSYLNSLAGDFSEYDLSIPLFWQYDYKELSDVFEIHSFDMGSTTSRNDVHVCKKEAFKRTGSVDAVVFWIDYDFPKAGMTFSTNSRPYNQLVRMLPSPAVNVGESDLVGAVLCIEFSCGG